MGDKWWIIVVILVAVALIDWYVQKHSKVKAKPEVPYPEQFGQIRRRIEEYIETEGIPVQDKPGEMFKAIHSAVTRLWGKHPIPGVNRRWNTALLNRSSWNKTQVSSYSTVG